MKLVEYMRRYDALPKEDSLSNIPLRKEVLLKEIGRGKKVLDLGCLGGQITKLIQEQNNEVHAIEINPKAAALAESRGLSVKVADLNEGIPFPKSSFDVVNAGEVVEQIYDTKSLFEECNRVLRPNGILLLTTPNLNSLTNRIRILRGEYPAQLGAFPEDHFGEYIRVFNIEKIRELCRHTGFRVESVSGVTDTSLHSNRFRWLYPLTVVLPQFADVLVVKVRKLDQ